MVQVDGYPTVGPAPVRAVGTRVPARFTGSVSAVFDNALNVRVDGDRMIVSLVTRRSGLSARAILVGRLPQGVPVGTVLIASTGAVRALEAHRARASPRPLLRWDPDRPPGYDGRVTVVTGENPETAAWTEATVDALGNGTMRSVARTLRSVLSASCAGKGGFLSLLGMGAADAFASKAAGALSDGRGEECIGLGIGLTPSGDDFLTGAMLTCDVLGVKCTSISRVRIEERLRDRSATTEVSRTQLLLALDGHAPAFLLPLLEVIASAAFRPPSVEEVRIAALNAVSHGHSSGCDAVAGVVWAIERMNTE
ncbi:MAG: DUF2877 domain-containing protein [Spirochaetales bacterium]